MAMASALSAAFKHAPPLHASDDGLAVPGAKNAKVIQVYEHPVPGVHGKSIKGVTVEYGPGGYSPCRSMTSLK